MRGADVFIPARVRAMNDSVRSNGASVYRGPPPCIVVIKLLMNSLMRLGPTERMARVNNARTTPAPSSVTRTELKEIKMEKKKKSRMELHFFLLMTLGIAERLKPFS